MTRSERVIADGIRDVNDDEVAHFRHNGWAKLDGLLTPDLVGLLLDRARTFMGADGKTVTSVGRRSTHDARMWNCYENPSFHDPLYLGFATSPRLGWVGSRLLRDRPVRFMRDEILVKVPLDGMQGLATGWHQDFPYASRDRSAQVTVWIALDNVPPRRGSLQFLSGSHTWGVLGRTLDDPHNDLVVQYPELLKECEMSPPMHLRPGDATVHGGLTVHCSAANTTDRPRWAHTVWLFQADALYTGSPQRFTDQLDGLELDKPLDHPRTPIIWPPAHLRP